MGDINHAIYTQGQHILKDLGRVAINVTYGVLPPSASHDYDPSSTFLSFSPALKGFR